MKHWRVVCLAVIGGLVAAACGNGASTSGGPLPHGNVLYYAAPGEPDSLDPGAGISGFDGYYLTAIFDTLVHTNPKTLKTEPGLATSWTWSADHMSLRLNLRHGATFQDGSPVDAAAVKASLDHYRAAGFWSDLSPVSGETVVDASTVDVNLKSQYSPLPDILAGRAGMLVSPAALQKYGKDFGKHPVGAGQYSFQAWTPGAEVDVSKFSGYWDKAAPPRFKGVAFKVFADPIAMMNAVQSGQVDLAAITNATASNIQVLKKSSRVNTDVTDVNGVAVITTNNRQAPFNNVLVRQAVNMSIDRQALSDAVNGKGVGKGPACQYEAPDYWTYSKDLKCWKYDPAQAKQLLAQAGYPNGVTVSICNYATDTTAVQIEKQTMARAGITLQISQQPVNACVASLRSGNIPMVQIGWIGNASAYYTFQTMFGANATGGFGPYQNVDGLLSKVSSVYTQQEQKPYFDQLNKTLHDQAPSVPLYYLIRVVSYSKRLHGFSTDPSAANRIEQAYFQ